MKRDLDDFHAIKAEHADIHSRLINWSRYIAANGHKASCAPMFRHYRSSEVWAEIRVNEPIDRLDGHVLEKAIGALPDKHKWGLRWHYVYSWGGDGRRPVPPHAAQKFLALNRSGLVEIIHAGRTMLKNRATTTYSA